MSYSDVLKRKYFDRGISRSSAEHHRAFDKLPFINIFYKANAIQRFNKNIVKVIRSGLTANPLQALNYVSGDIFSNNILAKHGDSFFIGGDTATFEYDFSTKINGSVAECPCKVYRTNLGNTLLSPSDVNWSEYSTGDQAAIDLIKTQDNSAKVFSVTINNIIAQLMVEIDLTPLANAYFGGSNSALKSALKKITVDSWAMGSGASGGTQTYGVSTKIWADDLAWHDPTGSGVNTLNSIANKQIYTGNASYLQVSNKIYILIASQYSSDGSISSSVSLDYINVKVDLTRSVDNVQPISVNLPKYFAVVGAFSPNWDNTYAVKNSRVFESVKDSSNKWQLIWDAPGKRFVLYKIINGVSATISQIVPTFLKNQIWKFAVGQNANGMFMYLLKNNGAVEKYTNTDNQQLTGLMQVYPMQKSDNTLQGDMFADTFNLIDLTGKPNGYTDAEAEILLRGIPVPSTDEMVVNGTFDGQDSRVPELVVNGGFDNTTGWNLPSGVSIINGQLVIDNTTGTYRIADQTINVTPNTTYSIKVGSSTGFVGLDGMNGATTTQNNMVNYSQGETGIKYFTTGASTTSVKIALYNGIITTGTFTFDNISLKQASYGWNNISANWNFSNGIATLTATGAYQQIYQDFYVIPNSNYTINGILTGTNGRVIAQYLLGDNTVISTDTTNALSSSVSSATLKTPSNCVKVRMYCDNGNTTNGTYTFDNISLKYVKPVGAIAIENRELFDINAVTLHANATRSNGVITLNATGAWQSSTSNMIPVLPNNRYELSIGTNIGHVVTTEYYNNIVTKSNSCNFDNATGAKTFITGANTNKVQILFTNASDNSTGIGTFKWSNISLRRKD